MSHPQHLHRAADLAFQPVVVFSANGDVIFANRPFRSWMGETKFDGVLPELKRKAVACAQTSEDSNQVIRRSQPDGTVAAFGATFKWHDSVVVCLLSGQNSPDFFQKQVVNWSLQLDACGVVEFDFSSSVLRYIHVSERYADVLESSGVPRRLPRASDDAHLDQRGFSLAEADSRHWAAVCRACAHLPLDFRVALPVGSRVFDHVLRFAGESADGDRLVFFLRLLDAPHALPHRLSPDASIGASGPTAASPAAAAAATPAAERGSGGDGGNGGNQLAVADVLDWFRGADAGDRRRLLGGLLSELAPHERDLVLSERIAQLEALLEARTSELEAAVEVKNRFVSVMSHEMRTPLSGIVSHLNMIRLDRLPADTAESVDTARVCGRQLELLISDVLDYTNMESSTLTLESVPFLLYNTMEEALEIVSFGAQRRRVELICDVERPIPEVVCGDSGRLRQILVCLLSNACKFSPSGAEVLLQASAELVSPPAPTPTDPARPAEPGAAEGSYYELSFAVRDWGVGISDAVKSKLFQPFQQADSSVTRPYGGIGLGLYMSKKLVELMGGWIGVESSEGFGSTVSFRIRAPKTSRKARLDLLAQQRCAVGGVRREPAVAAGGVALPPLGVPVLRVLVVDPSANLLRVLARHMHGWGWAVTTASTVNDAFVLLTTQNARRSVSMFEQRSVARERLPPSSSSMPELSATAPPAVSGGSRPLTAAARRFEVIVIDNNFGRSIFERCRSLSADTLLVQMGFEPLDLAPEIPGVPFLHKPVQRAALLSTIASWAEARAKGAAEPPRPVRRASLPPGSAALPAAAAYAVYAGYGAYGSPSGGPPYTAPPLGGHGSGSQPVSPSSPDAPSGARPMQKSYSTPSGSVSPRHEAKSVSSESPPHPSGSSSTSSSSTSLRSSGATHGAYALHPLHAASSPSLLPREVRSRLRASQTSVGTSSSQDELSGNLSGPDDSHTSSASSYSSSGGGARHARQQQPQSLGQFQPQHHHHRSSSTRHVHLSPGHRRSTVDWSVVQPGLVAPGGGLDDWAHQHQGRRHSSIALPTGRVIERSLSGVSNSSSYSDFSSESTYTGSSGSSSTASFYVAGAYASPPGVGLGGMASVQSMTRSQSQSYGAALSGAGRRTLRTVASLPPVISFDESALSEPPAEPGASRAPDAPASPRASLSPTLGLSASMVLPSEAGSAVGESTSLSSDIVALRRSSTGSIEGSWGQHADVDLRILIAEDNEMNTRILQRLLNALGRFEIATVVNGRLAVDAVKQRQFDVVLMDIMMPDMDGVEATKAIRQLPLLQPRIIAVTTNTTPEDRARYAAAGIDDLLPKPIKPKLLAEMLKRP